MQFLAVSGSLLAGPGVIYSDVVRMTIDASSVARPTELVASNLVPDSDIAWPHTPPDSKYIKHLTLKSERLSKFWGTDVYLQVRRGHNSTSNNNNNNKESDDDDACFPSPLVIEQACVLIPEGWEEKTDVKYPLFIYHGHYHPDFATPNYWSDQPPKDPSTYPTPYAYEEALYAYYFFRCPFSSLLLRR